MIKITDEKFQKITLSFALNTIFSWIYSYFNKIRKEETNELMKEGTND